MQPNNQMPGQSFEPTYLDAIATKPPVKTVNPLLLWGLIGGLLLVTVLVVLGISTSSSSTSSASLATVGAKLSNLQTVADNAQDDIQSGELRSLNSNLSLSLANTNRDLAVVLKAQKISLKDTKKNKGLLAVKNDFDALKSRLEDARLNAVYDRTYAREITYAIKTLHADMGELYKSTKSKDLKTILDKADESFNVLIEGFGTFNES